MRGPISSWDPRTVDSVHGGLADLPAVARRVREEAVNLRLPLKQDGGLRCANLPWRCFWPKGDTGSAVVLDGTPIRVHMSGNRHLAERPGALLCH